tara:strand:+ start:90 stop:962 length:873 start_codon:yes stop_codon:yes gene_type:complete
MNNYIKGLTLVLFASIASLTILTVSADEQDKLGILTPETVESSVARLLSAFFGLDNKLPFRSNRLCLGASGQDGMPVVFSHTLNTETVNESDFEVETRSGEVYSPICVTLRPADDEGENRTVLLIGEFGNAETDPPERVSIVGDLHSDSEDSKPLNFKGLYTDVIPLDSGPALILAERVPREVWSKERRGTMCPDSSRQVIRVTWTGGVRLPNGNELGEIERSLYRIELEGENDRRLSLQPDYLADLEDRDNNHLLCLDSEFPAISVSFPAGHLVDPNRDLNLDSFVLVL